MEQVAPDSTKVGSATGADMGEVVRSSSARDQERGELLGRGGGKKSDGEVICERERRERNSREIEVEMEDVSESVGGHE